MKQVTSLSGAAGETGGVRGYAMAHLHKVRAHEDIVMYLREIDATLAPHGGRFLIHGGGVRVVEGPWSGDVIVIEFPTPGHAEAWYDSGAYQRILPLRRRHADGWAVLLEGAPADHAATDVLTSR